MFTSMRSLSRDAASLAEIAYETKSVNMYHIWCIWTYLKSHCCSFAVSAESGKREASGTSEAEHALFRGQESDLVQE